MQTIQINPVGAVISVKSVYQAKKHEVEGTCVAYIPAGTVLSSSQIKRYDLENYSGKKSVLKVDRVVIKTLKGSYSIVPIWMDAELSFNDQN